MMAACFARRRPSITVATIALRDLGSQRSHWLKADVLSPPAHAQTRPLLPNLPQPTRRHHLDHDERWPILNPQALDQ